MQPKADDQRPTQTEITSCDQSTEEKPVFLATKFPPITEGIDRSSTELHEIFREGWVSSLSRFWPGGNGEKSRKTMRLHRCHRLL